MISSSEASTEGAASRPLSPIDHATAQMTPAMAAASIERSRVRQRAAALGGSVAGVGDDVTRSCSCPYGGPVWRSLDRYGGASQPGGDDRGGRDVVRR